MSDEARKQELEDAWAGIRNAIEDACLDGFYSDFATQLAAYVDLRIEMATRDILKTMGVEQRSPLD